MINILYQKYLNSSGISTDTRCLIENELFFCLSGAHFNGNRFAEQAIERGASAVIIDDEHYLTNNEKMILVKNSLETLQGLASFHRDQLSIPIIGITGTNGKTTTKELVAAVLSSHFDISYTQGNLNNHIGVPLSLLKIKEQHEIAIIEMGANHLGEIEDLCRISRPNLGIITNIGYAHLEGFGSYENIKKTKLALYESIIKVSGIIFVNYDDEVLMSNSDGIKRMTYGISKESQTRVELSSESVSLEFNWKKSRIKTHLFGHYNLYNAAAAISLGKYFDVPNEKIVKALEDYTPSNNRSQIEEGKNNELILDAYNANPDSMRGAIQFFEKVVFPNKMVILGDMLELGDFEAKEHEKILNEIKEYSFIKTILVGNAFFKFEDKYPEFRFFKTNIEAKEFLVTQSLTGYKILLKGSRGIKLEVLKETLL